MLRPGLPHGRSIFVDADLLPGGQLQVFEQPYAEIVLTGYTTYFVTSY